MLSPHPTPTNPIIVGKVLTTHGVRGQIKVQSFTQNPSDLGKMHPFWINGQHFTEWRHFKPMGKPGIFLASLANVTTMNQAELMRHASVVIDRSQLPEISEAVYYSDLEGKSVTDCHGILMGHVVHVHDFGAGPILELSETGLMISFYAIIDATLPILQLKLPMESFQ